MMKLSTYVAKHLYFYLGVILIILMGLQFFFSFLAEFRDIGQGRFGIADGLIHAVMTLPKRFYQLFPEALLLACMLGMGALAETSELMAFRSFGCSPWYLWRTILWIFLPAIGALCVFTETLLPHLEYAAARYKAIRLSDAPITETAHGVWIREGERFTYFRKLNRLGHIDGFFRFAFDAEQRLIQVIHSPQAALHQGHFTLSKPRCVQWNSTTVQWETDDLEGEGPCGPDQTPWRTHIPPSILGLLTTSPEWLTWQELWQYAQYLDENHQPSQRYYFFMWRKALYPLLLVILPLMALWSVLGPLRQAHTGSRLLAGIVGGFLLHMAIEMLGATALLWHIAPVWLWAPLLGIWVGGLSWKLARL